MDVLRQYQYLLFELTQEIKRSTQNDLLATKFERIKQKAKKKQKESLVQRAGDSKVLYGQSPQHNVYPLFCWVFSIYQVSLLAVML